MKYQVLEPITLKTAKSEIDLQVKQIVKLNLDIASRLLRENKIAPLNNIFEEGFNELADKLSKYALTSDEIKKQKPQLYQQIQDAINQMDTAWLREDLETFIETTKKIEELYLKALRGIREW